MARPPSVSDLFRPLFGLSTFKCQYHDLLGNIPYFPYFQKVDLSHKLIQKGLTFSLKLQHHTKPKAETPLTAPPTPIISAPCQDGWTMTLAMARAIITADLREVLFKASLINRWNAFLEGLEMRRILWKRNQQEQ